MIVGGVFFKSGLLIIDGVDYIGMISWLDCCEVVLVNFGIFGIVEVVGEIYMLG